MRKIIVFLMLFIINITVCFAEPDYIYGTVAAAKYDLYNDTIIFEEGALDTPIVNIKNSLYLQNMGKITGDIFVSDGCQLNLRNSGSIDGQINFGTGSTLTQIINTNSDISQLNVDSVYSILVQDTDNINLSDVVNISNTADKIILDNSSFILSDDSDINTVSNSLINIELQGQINIILENIKDIDGIVLLSNVSGDGIVSIDISNLDSLYSAKAIRKDDEIILDIYRETDYEKILGTTLGEFANSLRGSSSRTIIAMDRASSSSSLYDVISKSVLFNPINLMRPVRLFNEFENSNFSEIKNRRKSENVSAIFEPIYIFSDGLNMYAGKATVLNTTRNFLFSFSGFGGYFGISDDINNYSGDFYGISVRSRYDNKYFWFDTNVSYTASDFNVGTVLEGNYLVTNPHGNMFYGTTSSGIKFRYHSLYLSPYVGLGGFQESVSDDYNSDVYGKAGGIIGFNVSKLGLVYRYSAFANTRTDSAINAGLKMEVWSIEDAAGGSLVYQIIKDDLAVSNKISANIKFSF